MVFEVSVCVVVCVNEGVVSGWRWAAEPLTRWLFAVKCTVSRER
jgi:hypothetical protein